MRMMTGCRWRRGVAALLLTLPMATMAGCDERSVIAAERPNGSAGGLDPHGRQACAEFRAGWRQATDAPARLLLADDVGRQARRSDNGEIVASSAAMGRSAKDGGRAWQVAAADLERACQQTRAGYHQPVLPVTG
ncbi:hypothetical protein [Actinoplanes utahensis]|uniref:Lipoprotein n=1 Tax=Actinoplanes utahensis TaxID=1869 RepID=A0A0A6X6S0_ACTUT|nr:hypothetical protein [Actinoplanes utahensis]KHD75787.1 hypothetical protein MB27_20265 [Actinoplanes utahensis]GIF32173.1 hypothetical protein Aut01nite_51590 [Actinoplanes utahensis]